MTYPTSNLSPLFKWTGGKRRELKRLLPHLPEFAIPGAAWKFVEPFAGGAAMYFALNHQRSHLNEMDAEVVNFYNMVAVQNPEFLRTVSRVAKLFAKTKPSRKDRDVQAAAYYRYRDMDRNGGLANLSPGRRAARFFIVNQLAFSGMRRFNASGEFNIPFGHYKGFPAAHIKNKAHVALLSASTITCGSYEHALAGNDNPNTFIFLDPPYTRVMKTYSSGNTFGESEQRLLADRLKSLTAASWMVVIDKSELTEHLYGDHIVETYDVAYGVNIKNRFDQNAKHIVATNYVTSTGATPACLKAVSKRPLAKSTRRPRSSKR